MEHVYEEQLRPRFRPEFAISREADWIDTAFVALVLGSLLFYLMLAQLAVLLMLSATAGIILLRWDRLPQAFATSWPLFSLPALCMASAAWSDVPATSLYYATLYTATALAGILIGSALNRSSYIDGSFIAFAIFAIGCLLFGRTVGHNNGGVAFAGLVGSKNTMGDMAAIGLMVTLAFVAFKLHQRRPVAAALALPFAPLIAAQLFLSKATGALIAALAGSALLIIWIVSRRLEIQVRSALLASSVILLVVGIATMQFWVEPVFDFVVEASGKDAGLTGRLDLWAYGESLISQRPIAGLGYAAFWLENNLDAERLKLMMGVSNTAVFNFHSTPMELIVHLGYLGFALACLVALFASARLIYRSALAPEYSAIFACALLAFWSVKTPFEVIAFSPVHFSTVTVYAVLAMGLRRDRSQAIVKRYRST
ncbi:MAG: O-antigen ligase family protein [Pseudomonadota bacterium]